MKSAYVLRTQWKETIFALWEFQKEMRKKRRDRKYTKGNNGQKLSKPGERNGRPDPWGLKDPK